MFSNPGALFSGHVAESDILSSFIHVDLKQGVRHCIGLKDDSAASDGKHTFMPSIPAASLSFGMTEQIQMFSKLKSLVLKAFESLSYSCYVYW